MNLEEINKSNLVLMFLMNMTSISADMSEDQCYTSRSIPLMQSGKREVRYLGCMNIDIGDEQQLWSAQV